MSSNFVSGSLFEEDYLLRTLRGISTSPDIALTELVANAWDAGAEVVRITIPDVKDELLIVEDDGTGLTAQQFHERWMKLGYNRLKHQGNQVLFPDGRSGKRIAFGRNGVGRHGLLCFNDTYQVETKCDGNISTFTISTQSGNDPFVLVDQDSKKGSSGTGTTLRVKVTRHLPNPDKILNILSARFLHDPNFRVYINGEIVPLEQLTGHIDSKDVVVEGIKLKFHFIDTSATAKTTQHQGVAFWQSGRLVGKPSWVIGDRSLIDGRTKYAKRYTAVVETSDLDEYVKEDWSGFIEHDNLNKVYDAVFDYVNSMFGEIARTYIGETKAQIHTDYEPQIRELSALGRYEIDEAIEVIASNHPTTRPEVLSIAVETVISLEKTRNGKALLMKLSELSDEDIAGLNRLLDEWSIKDALCVLDEIDRRLSVIEAINKLSNDKEVDELKVLHPLITEARWLFGPEYDSPEFSSNRQLVTVVEQIFGKRINKDEFVNHKKRPDLVVLNDASLAITCTEGFNSDSGLSEIQNILIIELKRGGFKLGREERNQAIGYIEDLIGCGSLIGNPFINAFVVGDTIADKLTPIAGVSNINQVERGKLRITNYGQLVDTAEKRLFNLRNKLSERYDDVPGMDLYRKSIEQLPLKL